jgi:hypothetical protein
VIRIVQLTPFETLTTTSVTDRDRRLVVPEEAKVIFVEADAQVNGVFLVLATFSVRVSLFLVLGGIFGLRELDLCAGKRLVNLSN